MKWVYRAVGAVIGLGVLVYLVGLLLPATHVAASALDLPAPVDSVWSVVRDFESYPEWWSMAASMTRLPDRDGHETWHQAQPSDPGFPLEVLVDEAPARLVTRVVDDGLPFGGTWTYRLEPTSAGEGTRLSIREDGVIYNPIFRVVARLVLGFHGTQESYLNAMAGRFGVEGPVTRIE